MAQGKTILLVDDSDLIAGVLSEYFTAAGYTVLRAKNGIEGIEMTYRNIPDVIIMDVEMPVLQGYQASRILKSRRGVRDIPIIMHTSLSEDRDEYWARSSGADEFVTKNFDNLEPLMVRVTNLSDHPPFRTELISEDAAQVNRDFIMEILGTIIDRQLFQSTIMNELSGVGTCITSLRDTAENILGLLDRTCDHHVAVLLLYYHRKCLAFLLPSAQVYENEAEDFFNICLNDFYTTFSDTIPGSVEKSIFAIEKREDYRKTRIDSRKINSYSQFELPGACDIIGTLHVGNFTNNYFSDLICDNIRVFAKGAGMLLENAMHLKYTSEMEIKIRNIFSKFVPAEIIDDMIGRTGTSSLLSGEKRSVAVLFSDIRSFTVISENNTPEDVVAFLNSFFEVMGNAIQKHGGTIDKFIGDAILAVFGAPTSYENNSERAVLAALEMFSSLSLLDTANLKLPPKGLDIGIGIHEGDVIVGNIGSKDKFDYTVIGDTVNLASRLEGLTKHYSSHIIVSQSIQDRLSGKILFRELDNVRVKGKEIPTTIYKLENIRKNSFPDEAVKLYNKALSMYKIQNWDTAIEYFTRVLATIPDDDVSQMYIDRCNNYKVSPPPKDWDGTRDLDFK